MTTIKFNTAKQMVSWLMNNEGKELADHYGRKWVYNSLAFYYQDLGDKEFKVNTIGCLHLYSTGFKYNL